VIRRLVPSRAFLWLLVFVVALAALFVRLGFWQLHRLHERRAFAASVHRAERHPPRPIEALIRPGAAPDVIAYHRVTATGTYETGDEVILYGRALHGRPGNHVLTPLLTANGRALIVDRGWVPAGMDRPPVPAAAAPRGRVTIAGLLLPPEETTTGSGKVEAITRVDLLRIGAGLPYPVYPVYAQLQRQSPPQTGRLPIVLPPPDVTSGPPNLSYAIQWFSFAAIALVGYVVLALRRGGDVTSTAGSPGSVPAPEPARPAGRP
jgi:cytochrome oxidase assembly protein ShyY1